MENVRGENLLLCLIEDRHLDGGGGNGGCDIERGSEAARLTLRRGD